MAVYNGEQFIRSAVDSLLAQTFGDFELIISDNASTDGTEAICREYAAADPRVRYLRQEVNRGAIVNHNLLVDLAGADRFKWMAHDDVCEPGYLEACMAALDAHPEAVLCHSDTVVIDVDGKPLRTVSPGQLATSPIPRERFRDVVLAPEDHRVFEMYGIMPTSAVRAAGGQGEFEGSDYPWLADLALRGPFVRVARPLFANRVVPKERYDEHPTYDPTKGAVPRGYHLRMLWEFSKVIVRHRMSPADRVRCFGYLGNDLPRKVRTLVAETAGGVRARARARARARV